MWVRFIFNNIFNGFNDFDDSSVRNSPQGYMNMALTAFHKNNSSNVICMYKHDYTSVSFLTKYKNWKKKNLSSSKNFCFGVSWAQKCYKTFMIVCAVSLFVWSAREETTQSLSTKSYKLYHYDGTQTSAYNVRCG